MKRDGGEKEIEELKEEKVMKTMNKREKRKKIKEEKEEFIFSFFHSLIFLSLSSPLLCLHFFVSITNLLFLFLLVSSSCSFFSSLSSKLECEGVNDELVGASDGGRGRPEGREGREKKIERKRGRRGEGEEGGEEEDGGKW
jgi:hypothetical protein